MNLEQLTTETRNENSMRIDRVTTMEMVAIMNREDQKIALCISDVLPDIARAIDQASARFDNGGRIITVGAGTSGRLGMLDTIELNPTYSVRPTRAFGLIAGGERAMFQAVEGAEDSRELGACDLKKATLSDQDIVIGLAASGRTPYVIGAFEYANEVGALTISIACNKPSEMGKVAKIGIDVVLGPEVITGSTRMKSGSAQKMILNMLSTGIMIRTGKVYQNLMINVQATNEKLVNRGIRIVSQATGTSPDQAEKVFRQAGQKVNVAILMLELGITADEALCLLEEKDGNIANVIKSLRI